MPEMRVERFNVSADDLRKYKWQEQITSNGEKNWLTSRYQFANSAKQCKDAGDDVGFRVYSLLHAVASFHANYDSEGNPYGACFTSPTGERSLIAEDLSDADLDALAGIVKHKRREREIAKRVEKKNL